VDGHRRSRGDPDDPRPVAKELLRREWETSPCCNFWADTGCAAAVVLLAVGTAAFTVGARYGNPGIVATLGVALITAG